MLKIFFFEGDLLIFILYLFFLVAPAILLLDVDFIGFSLKTFQYRKLFKKLMKNDRFF